MAAEQDKKLIEAARKTRLLILDVDGVLTDGGIILGGDGTELKRFHVRDGHGIKLVQRAGIPVAIITGRQSDVVERRAAELGITDVYQRCLDKIVAYEDLTQKHGLEDSQVAYVGDDVVDIPIFRRVGLSVAVADATEEARAEAMMITSLGGGMGAVREVTDFILKAGGRWDDVVSRYY